MKTLLLRGETIYLTNEEYQVSIESDDIRVAEVLLIKGMFGIWFNGELIHLSKTFISMEKRLNILIKKWNLK